MKSTLARIYARIKRSGPQTPEQIAAALYMDLDVVKKACSNLDHRTRCITNLNRGHIGQLWAINLNAPAPVFIERKPQTKRRAKPVTPKAPRPEPSFYSPMPPCELALIWAPVRPTEKERACCNS